MEQNSHFPKTRFYTNKKQKSLLISEQKQKQTRKNERTKSLTKTIEQLPKRKREYKKSLYTKNKINQTTQVTADFLV